MTEIPCDDQIDQMMIDRMIDESGLDYPLESASDSQSQKPKIIKHFENPRVEADWHRIVGDNQRIMGG